MKKLFFCFLPIAIMLWGCPAGKSTKPIYLSATEDIDKLPEIENKFERFKQQILGHFSNQEQVKAGRTTEREQEFIIIPIFKERSDFWVYLEFFSPALLDQPIDQRIERYVRVSPDTIRMEVYYIKEQEKYKNAWKEKEPFDKIDVKRDLIRDSNCDLLIASDPDKRHSYKTVDPKEINCEMRTTGGGADYSQLYFSLSDEGYNMRFKFYKKDKTLMKETSEEGLEFKRLNYKDENYKDYTKVDKGR